MWAGLQGLAVVSDRTFDVTLALNGSRISAISRLALRCFTRVSLHRIKGLTVANSEMDVKQTVHSVTFPLCRPIALSYQPRATSFIHFPVIFVRPFSHLCRCRLEKNAKPEAQTTGVKQHSELHKLIFFQLKL